MRARSAMIAFFCLALCLPVLPAAASEITPFGYIVTSSPEELADLREGPSDDAGVIASYFSGTTYRIGNAFIAENGYVFIFIQYEGSFAHGYMREEYLADPDFRDGYPIIDTYAVEVAAVRVPEGEASAPMRRGADAYALYDGTLVRVLGGGEGFYHVEPKSYADGFIDEEYIERGGEPSWRLGIAPRGYAVVRPHAYESFGGMTEYPGSINPHLSPSGSDPVSGKTMYLLSASDRDAQLWSGFLPLGAVSLYWYDDLYVSASPLDEGQYTAGEDMPSGLYTFTAVAGQSGMIRTTVRGVQREYTAEDEAAYTLYLPSGMHVQVTGGTLRPTVSTPYFEQGKTFVYSGTGRRFLDPDTSSTTFEISVMKGADHATYTMANLLYEEGESEALEEGELAPGEVRTIHWFPGTFIWIENCELKATFSNG